MSNNIDNICNNIIDSIGTLNNIQEKLEIKKNNLNLLIGLKNNILINIKIRETKIKNLTNQLSLILSEENIELDYIINNGKFLFDTNFNDVEKLVNSIDQIKLNEIKNIPIYLPGIKTKCYLSEIESIKKFNPFYSDYIYVKKNNQDFKFIINKQHFINCNIKKEINRLDSEIYILKTTKLNHLDLLFKSLEVISDDILSFIIKLLIEKNYQSEHIKFIIIQLLEFYNIEY